eukprot:1896317-Pyramimonas_sp.AAC.1
MTRSRRMLGKVKRDAKYLGGRLRFQGSSKPEVELRVRRARQAFAVLGSVWSDSRNVKWRAAVFKSMVEGSLLAELIACPLSGSDLQRLEGVQAHLARRALQGKGCLKIAAASECPQTYRALPTRR